MADIFVSYSRQDSARVEPLVKALEAEGWSVWWDPAITPGDEFDALIADELDSAKAVVVVWSPTSVDSRWVKGEAREAADRSVLVPVRFDNARLPIDVRSIHTTDLDNWGNDPGSDAFKSLCTALRAKLKTPAGSAKEKAADTRPTIAICVLPFANMSGDPEQDYFSDGVTEDIITDLSKVAALSVVSRNTAFSFKGQNVDVGHVARQTKVSHVLEGSVRKAGNRVRITAQLINAKNDAHLWAERYDRDLDDIFALQDEISEAVVKALKLKLLPEEKKALEHRETSNPEAYKLYLMARQFSIMGNERHQPLIVRICQRAVELDPNYARAWATMAIAQWDIHRKDSSLDNGETAAARALELDPELSASHAARGAVCQGLGLYEEGIEECNEALRINPNSYHGNRFAALCYMALRRPKEAIPHFEKAIATIDTEFFACGLVIQCYEDLDDIPKAKIAAKRTLERVEKIIAVEPDHGRALAYGVGALARLGEVERAREWIARGRLLDPDNVTLHFNFACAMSRVGDTEMAIELLQGILDKASKGWLRWLETDSDLDPIRDDPRFIAMVEKSRERFKTPSN